MTSVTKFKLMKRSYLFMLICSFLLMSSVTSYGQTFDHKYYSTSHSEIIRNDITLDDTCLVPCYKIVNGGPPPDGIPSIDDPKFYTIAEAESYVADTERVLAVEFDGQMYVYPHDILNWHEIVNQRINGAIQSITYCPLTGTGIPFHSREGGLGTSGKLYENNLVFYDRDTETYWSQMYGLAIKGERIGEQKEFGEIIQGSFNAIKSMYPSALVLTRDTGYERDYDSYPYANVKYLSSETLLFRSEWNKEEKPYNLYHPKTNTLILTINNSYGLIAYPELNQDIPITISNFNMTISIFYDFNNHLAIPYQARLNGEFLYFEKVTNNDNYPENFGMSIYQDQFGNIWNMKGEAIDGPDAGEKLEQVTAYTGFWFAASVFFTDAPIYFAGTFQEPPSPDDPNFGEPPSNAASTSFDAPPDTGTFTDDRKLFMPIIFTVLMLPVIMIIYKRRTV